MMNGNRNNNWIKIIPNKNMGMGTRTRPKAKAAGVADLDFQASAPGLVPMVFFQMTALHCSFINTVQLAFDTIL
jgi:hypothetical protein